jgi:RNA polymerase sigma-70 factor, ECF subfamily
MDAYARYGPALVRKAMRILRSRDDAQDMVQALFLDLLQREEKDHDLAWLYRAITNRCLTFLRDEKNRARLLSVNDEALREAPRTRCDERAITMDLLLKLTETLDEPVLEVLVCRFFDDMTQEEIAAHLDVSRKTVQNRLDAAREAVERLTGAS